MSAPTLDRNPETTSAGTSAGHRRPRKQLMLVASALLALAVAVGASLAIATRPDASPAPSAARVAPVSAADNRNAPAEQGATVGQGRTAQPAKGSQVGSSAKASNPGSTATSSGLALADGNHDAYITSIDRANNRIVVDVVQVFTGDQAVAAAIADGRPRSEARYLYTWVRNQNPRLRTLPLASNLVIKLHDGCEGGRGHLLSTLAADARQRGPSGQRPYYYTLTVAGGQVQRIQEVLAINAC
jgi:hypothetical protein